MKGFIEVTDKTYKEKFCVSVSSIVCVRTATGDVQITLACFLPHKAKKWEAVGLWVDETYDEILAKINAATE